MTKILAAAIAGLLLSTGAMAHVRHERLSCPPGFVQSHDHCLRAGHVRRDVRTHDLALRDAAVRHELALRDARVRHDIYLNQAEARHAAALQRARVHHQAQLDAANRRHEQQLALRR